MPQTADLHSKAGAPTYVYNFTQLPLGWRQEKGCVAFHGLELTYVFGAIPVGLSSATTQGLARGGGCSVGLPAHDDQDMKVADQAATIWAQFAKTGNPSVKGLVEWPAYTADNKAYLLLGTPLEAKSVLRVRTLRRRRGRQTRSDLRAPRNVATQRKGCPHRDSPLILLVDSLGDLVRVHSPDEKRF